MNLSWEYIPALGNHSIIELGNLSLKDPLLEEQRSKPFAAKENHYIDTAKYKERKSTLQRQKQKQKQQQTATSNNPAQQEEEPGIHYPDTIAEQIERQRNRPIRYPSSSSRLVSRRLSCEIYDKVASHLFPQTSNLVFLENYSEVNIF